MNKANATRNKGNGQFSYQNKWERLCKCGATLGSHTAEAPHTNDDTDCEKFRPASKA